MFVGICGVGLADTVGFGGGGCFKTGLTGFRGEGDVGLATAGGICGAGLADTVGFGGGGHFETGLTGFRGAGDVGLATAGGIYGTGLADTVGFGGGGCFKTGLTGFRGVGDVGLATAAVGIFGAARLGGRRLGAVLRGADGGTYPLFVCEYDGGGLIGEEGLPDPPTSNVVAAGRKST